MKIVFAGTPIFTLPVLELIAKEFSLVGVLTAPSKRQGRKMEMKASDVFVYIELLKKNNVLPHDLPIFTPKEIDDELILSLASCHADLLVCFAYGKIFPKKMLDVFRFGGINIHPSLLPRWRGPAPIPFAIYSGDTVAGISIQRIAEKMDTGNIVAQKRFKIDREDTTESVLSSKVTSLSVELLSQVLINIDECIKNAQTQKEEEATYSRLLKKEDGHINWERSAIDIERQILAFTPWPGSHTFCNGKQLNIISAVALDDAKQTTQYDKEEDFPCGSVTGKKNNEGILVKTGSGLLCIRELQWQTKKVLQWKDFLNGTPSFIGSVLE